MTFFEHLVELRKAAHQFVDRHRHWRIRWRVHLPKYVIRFVTQPMQSALKEANLHPTLDLHASRGRFQSDHHLGDLHRHGAGFAGCAVPDLAVRGACAVQARAQRDQLDFCFRRYFSSWRGLPSVISSPCRTC